MSSLPKISNQECSDDDDVDRLSNLPEPLLIHILSLLPTDQAVATSILSKRWIHLWRNVHSLILHENANCFAIDDEKFEYFVNNVLISLDSKYIEKFYLVITASCDYDSVPIWLDAAVSRNTKVIDFRDFRPITAVSRHYFEFDLPCSLFTCKTLEDLHLDGLINFNVPNSIFLPNLKTVSVYYVKYQSEESLSKFLSGCPLLETLKIDRLNGDDLENFNIFSLSLRNLTFRCCRNETWPCKEGFKLEINAPALTHLYLSDDLSKSFSIENLNLLDEAEINLGDDHYAEADQYSKAVAKLLEGLHHVKKLSLTGGTLMALRHSGIMTSIQRLSQLTVTVKCCKWNSLLNYVEGSDNLEILKVTKINHCPDGTDHETCWRTPERTPICLLSSLKTISIDGFVGLVDELDMVAYMLKNAKFLKTMTIKVPHPFDAEAKTELLHKISKFPQGSNECEITLC